MIFCNEYAEYDWPSFLGISCGILMCCAGIALMVTKNAKVAKKKAM